MVAAASRVLLVDDEPDILGSLADYLQVGVPGVTFVRANDGQQALRELEKASVDLIITDFRMPVLDGLGLLVQVNERWPGTPAILLTAFPDMDLAVRALNDGRVRRFLTKPVEPSELRDLVKELLNAATAAKQREAALKRAASRGGAKSPPGNRSG
ncbi:MAG: response regulator [Candidatus Thermoplasmatota archaeon]